MRILQVITSLATGGAEKLLVDLVPRLRSLGHDVDICVFNGKNTPFKEQLAQCGCRIIELSSSGHYYSPILLYKLCKVVRGYDIVHTHNTAPQLFGAISGLFGSCRLVTTEHSSNNRRRNWNWYKLVDRWMYSQYDRVICISQKANINLKLYLGSFRTNIITILNGVDVDSFHNATPNPLLKKGSNRFTVVMVAGFRQEKDQDTVVKAFKHLAKSEYELWLVGDGERISVIKQLVSDLGLHDSVRFWGMRMDIAEILHTADAIVMSSHWEGLSLSSIEGMSVGKPFIASDVDGLREITEGAGVLFDHGDDLQLATIITRLRTDPALYKNVAEACYNRAKEYDIEKTALSYSSVYMDLTKRNDQ